MGFAGLLMHPHWTSDDSGNLLRVWVFLSDCTREVEIKLTFKYVDENTEEKIYIWVLSIQKVNSCSRAIPTQTQFSHACTSIFLLQPTVNASKRTEFFQGQFFLESEASTN